jgi:hypothetical protein
LGDRFERRGAVLEQVSRAFDAKRLDVCGWGLADLSVKGTSE